MPGRFARLERSRFQNGLCTYLYAHLGGGRDATAASVSQRIRSRSSIVVKLVCLREVYEFVFIGFLGGSEGKFDYVEGEPWHKGAVSHKHLGTCFTDKRKSSSPRNLRFSGKPARLFTRTRFGIATADQDLSSCRGWAKSNSEA